MRVLTLWQPWATLFAYGIKKIETRPSPVKFYKGTYLIHAAQKQSKMQAELCQTEPFKSYLLGLGISNFLQLPFGCIIGAYEHVECIKIGHLSHPILAPQTKKGIEVLGLNKTGEKYINVTMPERAFGDYTEGRFAWIGENHRVLINPLPYTSGQGYYQKFKGDTSLLVFKE